MALKSWEKYEQLRLRGEAMRQRGLTPTEIYRELGVARSTVYRWKSRGRGKGAQIRPSGRKPALTIRQQRQLERILEQGAVAYGFQTEMWTGKRIARVIWEQFKVRYHYKSMTYVMRSLGWSCQKPRRVAKERNEKEIQRWIKEEWPRIKKNT